MSVIRVAWGHATAPTALSSFDAALAEANVHNYNLITLSSVIPAEPPVERVGTAPDLGPAGQGLTVVQSHETVEPGSENPAVAGLGWLRSESGRGIFYEVAGTNRADVETAIRDGEVPDPTEVADCPRSVADVLLTGLATDPADRHDSAYAFRSALNRALR